MSADAARRSPNFPHGDQATEEGEEEQEPTNPMGGQEGGTFQPS
jgi:hypothetical protein